MLRESIKEASDNFPSPDALGGEKLNFCQSYIIPKITFVLTSSDGTLVLREGSVNACKVK